MGQGLTSTQFYVKGKIQSTRHEPKSNHVSLCISFVLLMESCAHSTGYAKALKKYLDPVQVRASILRNEQGSDNVDLEGKVIMITGANSGIGKEMATYAAAKGAHVYMVCRSKERAETAKKEIQSLTSNNQIDVLLGDLSILSQVKKVVTEFQAKEKKIDCLVCNAGILLNDRTENSDGNEITFACHLLGGSYYLSSLLLPTLKASGTESRVIYVSSGGMYNSKFPSWDQVTSTGKYKDEYDGQMAYVYAKRGQVLLAERMAQTHPEITWLSSHPGWVDTPAVDLAYGSKKKYLSPMRTIWEGAEGLTWLFWKERKALLNGGFYLDREPQTKHISGLFMREGSYTKNTKEDVDEMMEELKKACGL